MYECTFALLRDFNAKTRIVALGAPDSSDAQLGLEHNSSAIQIAQPDFPGTVAFRYRHSETVIEIKSNAPGALLGGTRCRGRIFALHGRRRCRGSDDRFGCRQIRI